MIPPRFAVIDISYELTETGVIIKATTDVPCHLWLRRTSTKPRIHLDPVLKRGLATHAEPRFCFVVPEDDEQDEPGDTPEHTFPQPDWPVCVTRYHYFWGKIAGNDSPSESAIFEFHRTQPPLTVDFYPDADPETETVDGYVGMRYSAPIDWATLVNMRGGSANDNSERIRAARIQAYSDVDTWLAIVRSPFLFNTSSIPTDKPIIKASLTVYGSHRDNGFDYTDFQINVFASNPADPTALHRYDYSSFSSTPLCDTPIAWLDWNFGTDIRPNEFILNTLGMAAINRGGITKLGLRNSNYDAPVIAPPWQSGFKFNLFECWSAEKGGLYRPKLSVTY